MCDPEDAIDEAYGRWLGSSGYADMKSYRDVFRDGWNAGTDHEARNCPQEGRIVALKAENERLNGLLQKRITFTCSVCGDPFSEPIQTFADMQGDEIMAPALCRDCGHGEED